MIPALRQAFNSAFTRQHYQQFLADLNRRYPGAIPNSGLQTYPSSTLPTGFADLLVNACEHIIDLILEPRFRELTERAIPENDRVPNENDHPHFLAFDFGVCEDGLGGWQPQLIEMQGFASLYGFQVLLPRDPAPAFFYTR